MTIPYYMEIIGGNRHQHISMVDEHVLSSPAIRTSPTADSPRVDTKTKKQRNKYTHITVVFKNKMPMITNG